MERHTIKMYPQGLGCCGQCAIGLISKRNFEREKVVNLNVPTRAVREEWIHLHAFPNIFNIDLIFYEAIILCGSITAHQRFWCHWGRESITARHRLRSRLKDPSQTHYRLRASLGIHKIPSSPPLPVRGNITAHHRLQIRWGDPSMPIIAYSAAADIHHSLSLHSWCPEVPRVVIEWWGKGWWMDAEISFFTGKCRKIFLNYAIRHSWR